MGRLQAAALAAGRHSRVSYTEDGSAPAPHTRPAPPKLASDRRLDAPGKCRWKRFLLRCPVKQEEHMIWAGGLAAEKC